MKPFFVWNKYFKQARSLLKQSVLMENQEQVVAK